MITTITQIILLISVCLLCFSTGFNLFLSIRNYKRDKKLEKELETLQEDLIKAADEVMEKEKALTEGVQNEQPTETASEE